ncbi:DoxX family protein [Sporomusa sp.]|uniref:DoxX family protein n=1 Tax=Sporomusa sp. TaxID=2078658 RepID=UPI002B850BD7|nr:DoxX family protein [Sporomusa sp.]HWR42017.1 DoxX family protein [Sporomusa sp.]
MKNILIFINQLFSTRRDYGLLIFRLGIGCMFMWHGFPKIIGGEHKWLEVGSAMGTLGIHFAPAFWGLLAGSTEFFGGLFFALGLFYRPVSFLLIGNMGIAFVSQMLEGKGLMKAAQSLEDGFSFLGALFVGPGRYSLDYYLGFINSKAESTTQLTEASSVS